MSKRRIIFYIIVILIAIIGLVCLALSIFQDGKNQILLPLGLLCNSIALISSCIANSKKK